MAKTIDSSSHMRFAQSAVGSKQRVWFVAQEQDDFRLLQLRDEHWAARTPEWPIAALCGVDRGGGNFEVIAVGADGELLIGVPGRFDESQIPGSEELTSRYGIIRDARFVGNEVFVVGMARQAYRRKANTWQDISQQIRGTGPRTAGFNGVGGIAPDNVYAVGFDGEIFRFDGVAWTKLDSPTSVALHSVMVLPTSHFVIAGTTGVLLQGIGNAIAPIQNDITRDNLYGLVEFRGTVYVSSQKQIFRLGSEGLEQVKVGIDGPLTFGHLSADAHVMYSVGARHILATEDGTSWRQVICTV